MLDPCQSSSNNWRLISFGTTWLPKLVQKKKKKKKPFPLSFSPSLASLYLFEQWLRLGVTSTSSVWLPLQDESLYVLPNCKSLWIKASAKWLNVNVNVIWIANGQNLHLVQKYLCFILLRGDLNICAWETDEKLTCLCSSSMNVLPSKSSSRSRDWKLSILLIFARFWYLILFSWQFFWHSNLAGWLITHFSVVWQTQNTHLILTLHRL